MLHRIVFLFSTLTFHSSLHGQMHDEEVKYHFTSNIFKTSSGFKPGVDLTVSIEESGRLLGAGIYYDTGTGKITGINAIHERYLLRKPRYPFSPYVFYNLIYRITYIPKAESTSPTYTATTVGGKARYASMEHYIGFGLKLKIAGELCIKSYLGFGCYLGSIKKPSDYNFEGQKTGSNGFSVLERTGIDFSF